MLNFGKKKYEYQILQAQGLMNEEQLNEFAKDGWKLVEIILVDYTYYFYLEREK